MSIGLIDKVESSSENPVREIPSSIFALQF